MLHSKRLDTLELFSDDLKTSWQSLKLCSLWCVWETDKGWKKVLVWQKTLFIKGYLHFHTHTLAQTHTPTLLNGHIIHSSLKLNFWTRTHTHTHNISTDIHTSLKTPRDAHKKTRVSNIWDLESFACSVVFLCVHVCLYVHNTSVSEPCRVTLIHIPVTRPVPLFIYIHELRLVWEDFSNCCYTLDSSLSIIVTHLYGFSHQWEI